MAANTHHHHNVDLRTIQIADQLVELRQLTIVQTTGAPHVTELGNTANTISCSIYLHFRLVVTVM